MAVIPPSATKHKLDGIGEASAAAALAALAANPSTSFLASGMSAKIIFWIFTKFFSGLASMGLVLLNVGADKLLTVYDKVNFDGSFESAEQFIEEIKKTGRELTDEEIKKIDGGVIATFRKFAKIGRRKK